MQLVQIKARPLIQATYADKWKKDENILGEPWMHLTISRFEGSGGFQTGVQRFSQPLRDLDQICIKKRAIR